MLLHPQSLNRKHCLPQAAVSDGLLQQLWEEQVWSRCIANLKILYKYATWSKVNRRAEFATKQTKTKQNTKSVFNN